MDSQDACQKPLPGVYGWVFPKGDHANFGIGGWERTGPMLRDQLRVLCRAHGVSEAKLEVEED